MIQPLFADAQLIRMRGSVIVVEVTTRMTEPAMSDRRTLANRSNASKSTGPQTIEGRAVASRNALRHGLRSNQLLLDGEDPEELVALQADLLEALAPVGAIELSLAERIVVAIWRQRRLARAESAALALERRDDEILDGLRRLHDYDERDDITTTCLRPFDAELVTWCRSVLDEVEAFEDHTLEELEKSAPHAWAQLKDEADEDNETPQAYLSSSENGLAEFLADLCNWCRRQLEARPLLFEDDGAAIPIERGFLDLELLIGGAYPRIANPSSHGVISRNK
jgi:hypothetical protein